MFSSKAFRMAGLVALCLFVGLALSGAWGGAQQQPLPPLQLLIPPPTNGIPDVGAARSLDDGTILAEVKECGSTVAQIISFGILSHRKDEGLEAIGGIRAYETLTTLDGKWAFPKGDYHLWLGHVQGLNLQLSPPPPHEFSWFMAMVNSKGELVAILYPWPWPGPPPEEMDGDTMLGGIINVPPNAIPMIDAVGCCDLTVRHLSVTAHKISPPCPVPPCPPPWWDIMALATVANIGQIAVQEPFTVRVLLNGRLIHEEEIAELAAGASQPILAAAMVDKPGIYIVTVIVDPDNKIKERDETNNFAERSVNIQ